MRCHLALACLLAACGADPAPAPPEPASEGEPRPVADGPARDSPQDPRDDPARDPDPAPARDPAAPLAGLDAPERGCVATAPVQVFTGDAWPAVAATRDGFVVAGVSRLGDGEHVFAAVLALDGGVRAIARRALDADAMAGHRRAGPGLLADGDDVTLVYLDGERRVVAASFEATGRGPLAPVRVGEGASLQFAPTLARLGQALWVAWTEPYREGRRVLAVQLRGGRAIPPVRDLSPPAGGGASPAFVRGADPQRLVYVDAREALSVVYRVAATPEGALGDAEMIRPVSLLTDPPHAVAFRMRGADWLVYTGIGAVATTAVGLVPLAGSQPPSAVVPGTGYGALFVDAAPLGDGAVIAADVPTDRAPDAPRELALRPLAPSGELGPALAIRGPRGSASRARVATREGLIAVAFADRDGAYAVLARCASTP